MKVYNWLKPARKQQNNENRMMDDGGHHADLAGLTSSSTPSGRRKRRFSLFHTSPKNHQQKKNPKSQHSRRYSNESGATNLTTSTGESSLHLADGIDSAGWTEDNDPRHQVIFDLKQVFVDRSQQETAEKSFIAIGEEVTFRKSETASGLSCIIEENSMDLSEDTKSESYPENMSRYAWLTKPNGSTISMDDKIFSNNTSADFEACSKTDTSEENLLVPETAGNGDLPVHEHNEDTSESLQPAVEEIVETGFKKLGIKGLVAFFEEKTVVAEEAPKAEQVSSEETPDAYATSASESSEELFEEEKMNETDVDSTHVFATSASECSEELQKIVMDSKVQGDKSEWTAFDNAFPPKAEYSTCTETPHFSASECLDDLSLLEEFSNASHLTQDQIQAFKDSNLTGSNSKSEPERSEDKELELHPDPTLSLANTSLFSDESSRSVDDESSYDSSSQRGQSSDYNDIAASSKNTETHNGRDPMEQKGVDGVNPPMEPMDVENPNTLPKDAAVDRSRSGIERNKQRRATEEQKRASRLASAKNCNHDDSRPLSLAQEIYSRAFGSCFAPDMKEPEKRNTNGVFKFLTGTLPEQTRKHANGL
eukprot:scaffold22565_cov97-Cylindrotheca_fusiformis.AAC.6